MSYELVKAVLYGPGRPTDPVSVLLLVAVAEEQRDADDAAEFSTEELAALIGMSRASAARRVKRLRDAGLLLVISGGGRKVPNGYRVGLEALSTGTENLLTQMSRNRHRKPAHNDEQESTGNLLTAVRQNLLTAVSSPPIVHRDSIPPPADTEPAATLLPLEGGTDDELDQAQVITVVMRDVPAGARPRDRQGLRRTLAAGIEAGWTPDALAAELAAERHDYGRIGGGAVLTSLERIIRRPAPREPWTSCGQCSNGWREDPDTGLPVAKCVCHPANGLHGTERPWQPGALTSAHEENASSRKMIRHA